MSITVCLFVRLFVNLSLCTVTDFSAGDKASGVKFCTMVHGRPGHGISHFGELCSSRSPKSDESAPVLKICSIQKGHRIKGAGVRTPWTPPRSAPECMIVLNVVDDFISRQLFVEC